LKFFRQTALLLPSAFLLGVLLFLLTHGHDDPAFASYPFFDQWRGSRGPASPDVRFLEQALLFFLPAYAAALLFVLGISLGERALFGSRRDRPRSGYGRAFALAFAVCFLAGTAMALFGAERLAKRVAPDTLVAPVIVAAAPFAGAAAALLPAALLAMPIALVRRRSPA
jgi:hypothetical protein